MNELPERLPSRPLRNWFLAWHIHTGDPVDIIAKGFDLDPVLVADLLTGEVPLMMAEDTMIEIAARLRLDPESLWGPLPDSHCRWVADPIEERHAWILSVVGADGESR